jgi:7,8-dihydropterin-6-yl-methyl-4-(beta-D-ribofuranosyl)aminobenzene 5'-phosphate synthase
MWITFLFLVLGLIGKTTAQTTEHQIQRFKITILSTMLVGDIEGIGEWGFAAVVDVDGHRMLVDTGAHPDTVIRNARDLHIGLWDLQEVILTHSHWDHVSGLLTLRRELMKDNPKALSIVHVSDGIFDSRPSETGEAQPDDRHSQRIRGDGRSLHCALLRRGIDSQQEFRID